MIWESWPWKQELRRLSSTIDAEGARVIDIEDEASLTLVLLRNHPPKDQMLINVSFQVSRG